MIPKVKIASHIWILCLLILSNHAEGQETQKAPILISALLPYPLHLFNGIDLVEGVKLALSDINSHPHILSDYQLTAQMYYTMVIIFFLPAIIYNKLLKFSFKKHL